MGHDVHLLSGSSTDGWTLRKHKPGSHVRTARGAASGCHLVGQVSAGAAPLSQRCPLRFRIEMVHCSFIVEQRWGFGPRDIIQAEGVLNFDPTGPLARTTPTEWKSLSRAGSFPTSRAAPGIPLLHAALRIRLAARTWPPSPEGTPIGPCGVSGHGRETVKA